MRHFLILPLFVLILASTLVVLSGCAFLFQETPVLELDSLRLSCAANPEIVDGDLGTEGVLQSIPGVARGGAGVLIRLDKSTYIKHVEIYAASRMFDVRIYIAAEKSKGNGEATFEPIREHYAKDSDIIGRGKMKKFRIGKEVLYLKLLTGWTVDATSGRKIEKSTTLGYDRVIPMIGPVVREVKFYTIGGVTTTQRSIITSPSTEIISNDGAPMVLIPAGEFLMGDEKGGADAKPVHIVYLDAFYMDVYEVTNGQYKEFVDATRHRTPALWDASTSGALDYPVVGVSWDDAQAYCEWAGKRLPTEAEWEKAARGGLVGKKYPWGDSLTHDDANYSGKDSKDQWIYTAPVGSFAPNGYGLYDIAGNVWERCSDWYDDWQNEGYYSRSPQQNPQGPDSGTCRIVRGGGWNSSTGWLSVAYRNGKVVPTATPPTVGFRCVKDIPR